MWVGKLELKPSEAGSWLTSAERRNCQLEPFVALT